ncbi:MAG TPA: polymer-forming cytoskeletal protein [Casimicrobiaceae bacterium]|nr:polymer-forming cytoskeletal protein [Casimicrobiaceae bacterium]
MLNFSRPTDAKDAKSPLKPAIYDPPASTPRSTTGPATRPAAPAAPASRDAAPPPLAPAEAPRQTMVQAPGAASPPVLTDTPGSKLYVGVNIKLKGVEISDCDALVIEGQVEATVHSKLMQVAAPGALKGTALIDVAEIQGEFSGELTARTRLVVHGTGRVSGTIRYGKLIVEEGGELTGDVKRLDAAGQPGVYATDSRHVVGPNQAPRSS